MLNLTLALGDGLIAIAYFGIPIQLIRLRIEGMPVFRSSRASLGFMLFILLCGITHINEIYALLTWQCHTPDTVFAYWRIIETFATAVVSWGVMLMLPCITRENWKEFDKDKSKLVEDIQLYEDALNKLVVNPPKLGELIRRALTLRRWT